MRPTFLCLTLVFFSLFSLNGQVEFGLKGGLHSVDLADNPISAVTGETVDGVSIVNSDYGIHFGLFTRISFLGLFLEPSLLFNSSSLSYRIDGTNESGNFSDIRKESFKNLDIPFMVGCKILFLDVFAGPVAHLKLDKAGDLFDFDGYGERMRNATYGYQVGTGLSLGSIKAQITYEGNLSTFGEEISLGDSSFTVDDRLARLMFTVGYKF